MSYGRPRCESEPFHKTVTFPFPYERASYHRILRYCSSKYFVARRHFGNFSHGLHPTVRHQRVALLRKNKYYHATAAMATDIAVYGPTDKGDNKANITYPKVTYM